MAVYLAPGVFTREVDLSALPASAGPLVPAFLGTAKKGPLNTPTLITSAQQAIDTFGEPFAESYLMYAVLSYLEEGGSCWVMRVAVECEDGLDAALADVCIDNSGSKGAGWGRLPVFTGIDFGRISLRLVDADNPVTFHSAAVTDIDFNDADLSTTDGATGATLGTTGTYTGSIDDSYVVLITGAPTTGSVDGAAYQIVRNSDGEVVATGMFDDGDNDGVSDYVVVDAGISIRVEVTSGVLDVNDTFTYRTRPDNRSFSVSVEGGVATSYTMPSATYTTVTALVTAFNALLTGEDYVMVEHTLEDGETVVPQLRTDVAGDRIQIMTSEAWALEMGSQRYAYDIPRSFLLGLDSGPYNITTANNRVKINVIGTSTTKSIEFNVPVGVGQTAAGIAMSVDAAGTTGGINYWNSFELTVPGGTTHVVIVTGDTQMYDTLHLQASYSNIKSLRFAEELNITYPYKRSYRGFNDNRVVLPAEGETTAAVPLSCEDDPASADCAADTAYFQNIVGFFVATSAGTWIDGYTISIELYTNGVGEVAGRYQVVVRDPAGNVVETVSDVSFDKRNARYIANLINPGSSLGGASGNYYINWEDRPAYLENDVNLTTYVVRLPSQFNNRTLKGTENGIPLDPAYSSALDAAIIGSPALSSGLYAFQNPESYDINLLATPGFSSGAVIGTGLQVCEARGDVLYLIDPPFGLRPQQVVDWHNGMLLSDLSSAINSSYGSLYWSWIRVFDQFSRTEIWIPPSGHVSAVYSRTARDTEQWFAPAGLRRGRLLTALDVEYSPSQGERELLYGFGNAVNPIVKFPQQGIVIWGQRTLQRENTALDRVNVRMLNIYLKKSLSVALRSYIFEPNDNILWNQVTAAVEGFMADVKARRGITAYKVVCDSSNNTPDRIDRNELWVSVFYQPTQTTEFVVLNLVTLRTGGSFSAEEVLAAAGIVG